MTLSNLTDTQAVLDAIAEYDAIGREEFLAKHSFGKSRAYFVDHDGKLYDSKAIVGVAYHNQHGRPLLARDFNGGEITVAARLEALGFLVTRPHQWSIPVGAETTRAEVSRIYGGSIYGGIEPSTRTPNVLIYTDPIQGAVNGYNFDGPDSDEKGVFYYTGEGRTGDQVLAEGNKAVLEHAQRGRTIRLFEAVDGKKRAGGKLQRYVGSFIVDPSAPYEFRPAPDADSNNRQVVVFRLLSQDEGPTIEAIPTSMLLGNAVFVKSENNAVTEYQTAPHTGSLAQREEAALVTRFEEHLRSQGHEARRVRIPIPGEKFTLVTDTYDATTNQLYEAKSDLSRATIRLAVGQLLDYLRFIPDAAGCLLLPGLPSQDLLAFVNQCGFGVTYPSKDDWVTVL